MQRCGARGGGSSLNPSSLNPLSITDRQTGPGLPQCDGAGPVGRLYLDRTGPHGAREAERRADGACRNETARTMRERRRASLVLALFLTHAPLFLTHRPTGSLEPVSLCGNSPPRARLHRERERGGGGHTRVRLAEGCQQRSGMFRRVFGPRLQIRASLASVNCRLPAHAPSMRRSRQSDSNGRS